MRNTEQDNLKYQKLYHWAHTLITSGVIKNMDKFPSETILQKNSVIPGRRCAQLSNS